MTIPTINIDGLGVTDIEELLGAKGVRLATRSTVNKLAVRAATAVKRAISRKYVIPQKNLVAKGTSNRNGMRVGKAPPDGTTAFVIAYGKALPVYRFKISPKSPEAFRQRKRGKGVTYTVQRGKKVRVKSAFVARMPSGHVGVFVRKGKKRTPIRELFGPSIPQMLGEADSINSINDVIRTAGPGVYEHELRFRMSKVFK